jgi:hypothetical protein
MKKKSVKEDHMHKQLFCKTVIQQLTSLHKNTINKLDI